MTIFTRRDLEEVIRADRKAVAVWMKAGLLQPSVKTASGAGTRQLFDWADLCRYGLLNLLHDGAVKLDGMRSLLAHVKDFDWDAAPPDKDAGRDQWLVVESIPDRVRVVRAAKWEEASRRLPRVMGINLSALQRTLRARLERRGARA
jgi:hypothetical protein